MTLAPATRTISLDRLSVDTDIGFHDFEIGRPQRILVSVRVWLDESAFARDDDPASAWNYDSLRSEVVALASSRRFNLQETLARAIYALIAARPGVTALSVSTRKPDIYPDCEGVGVDLASF